MSSTTFRRVCAWATLLAVAACGDGRLEGAGDAGGGGVGGGAGGGVGGGAGGGAGGGVGGAACSDAGASCIPDGGGETDLPVIVAVGYGGLRVRSLDHGLTWRDETQLADNGGDDQNLLRGATFGGGRFVAVGYRIFSSIDGADWTEHTNPTAQWYGAVAYGNGMFLAVGGGGYCARSDDGQAWETCTDATPGVGFVHVRSVLFHDGLFFAVDAEGVVRSSPDGDSWTASPTNLGTPWAAVVDGEIVARDQSAPAELSTVRLRGATPQAGTRTIERAPPGSDAFSPVFTIPHGNGVFQAYRFAFAEGRRR